MDTYPINWRDLMIMLTYRCNLSCGNCIAGCGRFTRGGADDMSLEQIEKLFQQTKDNSWKWNKIWLCGGECTLHPQFLEILNLFRKYQPALGHQILIATNGVNNLAMQKAIMNLGNWGTCGVDGTHLRVKTDLIVNSNKSAGVPALKTMYVAPMDVPELANKDFSAGCPILTECPVVLNKYGYYICVGLQTVDRILGLDAGIKDLKEFIQGDKAKAQLQQFCKYCGEYKFYTGLPFKESTEWLLSPTWIELKKKYDAAPSVLTPF